MLKFMMVLMSTLMVMPCFALQVKQVKDNETVQVYIAAQHKTRLFIKGSRIARLHGTPRACRYKNDNVLGQVFLLPSAPYQHKPFSLFVTSEAGKTYGLVLHPQHSLSETIMLVPRVKPQRVRRYKSFSTDTATDTHSIMRLIRAMVKGVLPTGFTRVTYTKAHGCLVKRFKKTMRLSLRTRFKGKQLNGAVYQLTNGSSHTITVQEQTFTVPGTRAIAILNHRLAPYERTMLYRVYCHG